jgi:hypothetical protein
VLAGLRRIAGWLARHWGFPANFQWWWLIFGLPSVPAVVGGLTSFIQNASWWVVALVIVGSYVVALGVTAAILPRLLPNRSIVGPQARTARAVSTQNETVGGRGIPLQQFLGETDNDLRRRSRELAQELFRFLDEQGYSRDEDPDDPGIDRRDAEALALPRFRESLRPRARNLLKKLRQRGLYPPENLADFQQQSIENPQSLWAVENLANVLNEIGHDW